MTWTVPSNETWMAKNRFLRSLSVHNLAMCCVLLQNVATVNYTAGNFLHHPIARDQPER